MPHTRRVRRTLASVVTTISISAVRAGAQASYPSPNDLPNSPVPNIAGTIGTAGGVPIRLGMEVIGAIGVSGSPGGDKDESRANAGTAKIADQLKDFVLPTP